MLARFGITARIFGGFAAVVALLLVVAASAFFGIRTLSNTIDQYDLAIGASGEISDYVADFHAMEVSAREYLLNPSPEVGQETLVWIDDVATNDAEGVAKFEHVDGAVETLSRIEEEAWALHAAFTEVIALAEQREGLVAEMNTADAELESALNELMGAAQADGNFDVAIKAGTAIQDVMHILQASIKFIETRNPADYQSIVSHTDEARTSLQNVSNSTFTMGITEQIARVNGSIDTHMGIVDQINTNLTQQQAITSEQLLVQREALVSSYGELTTMLREYQDALGPIARAAATNTALTVGIVSLISLIVAVGLAFVTGRWLSKAIGGMSANMRKLADGELDIELSGSEQRNELGLMAQALEVFKSNGQAMKEAEATKERERAEEQEEQRLRNAMQQEVARVVAAASNGDFSARITDQYGREDLDSFAQSLNDLMSSVERGVTETGQVLSALAKADLTLRVEGDYKGAFLKLKEDTNSVGDKLTDVISQLKSTSRTLKTATSEILSGANDLSERTTKQAATIEETSAAMEQLSSTVGDNAKKAESAAVSINQASRIAEEGGEVMGQATSAMERITNSSSKISNIIGMIDDIAFQTNLLALNASVEAARAGEAGKGFAVVAVEVRRLAQSAAEASSEVKTLIEQSASEVDGGSKLVAEAAEKLSSMLEAVQQNSALMNEISTASREQASSIDEVNTAVRQMDEMTQHNAALVEETNAAIEQTEAQANDLDRIVAVFTVRDGSQGQSAPAMSAAQEDKADKGFKAGIKGLQEKVSNAAKSYLSNGNAAVDQDWEEF